MCRHPIQSNVRWCLQWLQLHLLLRVNGWLWQLWVSLRPSQPVQHRNWVRARTRLHLEIRRVPGLHPVSSRRQNPRYWHWRVQILRWTHPRVRRMQPKRHFLRNLWIWVHQSWQPMRVLQEQVYSRLQNLQQLRMLRVWRWVYDSIRPLLDQALVIFRLVIIGDIIIINCYKVQE